MSDVTLFALAIVLNLIQLFLSVYFVKKQPKFNLKQNVK